MTECILETVQKALTLAQPHIQPGTEAHAEVVRALDAISKLDGRGATVGTSSGFNMKDRLWTFGFDKGSFRPGVGRYYIIPASDNLENHPPVK